MADELDGAGSGLLTADMAGRLLMISGERVRQLSKEGWIAKAGHNKFHLVDVVQGYLRFRNDADRRSTKTAADSRVRDARAREIELKNAQREGRLIEVDDAIEVVDKIVGVMLTGLSGLAARATRDLQVRRDIERAINETKQEIADTAAEETLAYRKTAETFGTVANDDGAALGREEQNAPH